MDSFEVLILPKQRASQQKILQSVAGACRGTITNGYQGACDWLVLFGWGGSEQQAAFKQHRAKGRPVLVLDYGFFSRGKTCYRMAVNDYFPTHQLHLARDSSRFDRLGIQLEDLHDQKGHAVLLELTSKSCRAFGYSNRAWERKQISALANRYPSTPVVIRPKRRTMHRWIQRVAATGDIRDVLSGASIAVVHHSNVAVDCAILGIPCVASHGVGAGFYAAEVCENAYRTEAERREWLGKVAWFDWSINESRQMIDFAEYIRGELS